MSDACFRCGREAQGSATIDGARYCHGDQTGPTCYMLASWEASSARVDRVVAEWQPRLVAKIKALEALAVERGVFPDTYLVGGRDG